MFTTKSALLADARARYQAQADACLARFTRVLDGVVRGEQVTPAENDAMLRVMELCTDL